MGWSRVAKGRVGGIQRLQFWCILSAINPTKVEWIYVFISDHPVATPLTACSTAIVGETPKNNGRNRLLLFGQWRKKLSTYSSVDWVALLGNSAIRNSLVSHRALGDFRVSKQGERQRRPWKRILSLCATALPPVASCCQLIDPETTVQRFYIQI